MNRTYSVEGTRILLLGETYAIKEAIKQEGGRWNPASRCWSIEQSPEGLQFLQKFGFLPAAEQDNCLSPAAQLSASHPATELSVSQFVHMVEKIVRKNLSDFYWLCGEISNLKSSGGHVFFDLVEKSDDAVFSRYSLKTASVSCILWSGKRKMLSDKLDRILFQDGTKVKIKFSCDFRKEGARICLIVEDIDSEHTQGALLLQRAAIVQELKKRGLYGKNKTLRMKAIPLRVALLSAAQSRAVADFIDELRLSRLAFQVTLFDCHTQGEHTSANVCAALGQISESMASFDCVVITRGGGSKLDLRWFDDLEIAKHIAYSPHPVVVAVGHFDDISIADEVAFHSEKTPTAAARYLSGLVFDTLSTFFTRIERASQALVRRFARERQVVLDLERRCLGAVRKRLQSEKRRVEHLEQMLRIFQGQLAKPLSQGFALVYDDEGGLVSGKKALASAVGQIFTLKFAGDCANEQIFVEVSVNKVWPAKNPQKE